MHSAINVGQDGDPAIFFGLSGTGKTTLSADPRAEPDRRRRARLGRRPACSTSRAAATPRRSACRRCTSRTSSRRPAASGRSSRTSTSIRATRELDLDSERFTENTRGAYPLEFIGNADPTGMAGQPRNVVLLTADAFGVLPPIARLTHDQAAYHFISGYTAKLAGTEIGVKEPKATFSTCFGAPFMPRHPGEYAAHARRAPGRAGDVPVWLVNTGWTGGPYGTGERMNIDHTRSMVRAALNGALDDVPTVVDPRFGLAVPTQLPRRAGRVPPAAHDLAGSRRLRSDRRQARPRCSRDNFEAFADGVDEDVRSAGPRTSA